MTLLINSFFGWDFNSCEALRKDGEWHPIDFANACPDSQVTSLHYHFPWLVAANLRWSIFCAATKRPMRRTLDWQPYYDVLEEGRPPRERLAAYAAIARQRFDTDALRGVLRHPPRPPRRGAVGVLRHRHRQGRRPPEGRRPVPRARGRRVHRAVLGPRPAVAGRERGAGEHRHEGADDLVLVDASSATSRWRGGATTAPRSWCSRPPAGTPRRSSASTSSTRSVSCSTPAG